jgi:hypothetical protein
LPFLSIGVKGAATNPSNLSALIIGLVLRVYKSIENLNWFRAAGNYLRHITHDVSGKDHPDPLVSGSSNNKAEENPYKSE